MSATTSIQWTDSTWPVVAGCERISSGCAACYAIRDARRLSGNPNPKVSAVYAGTVERTPNGKLDWTGRVRPLPKRLDWPLRWRKPRRVFVCNESDLFHEGVPDEFIAEVFAVMASAPRHTFQVLTKRPEGMRAWFRGCAPDVLDAFRRRRELGEEYPEFERPVGAWPGWPLPNVWLGVSAENQDALRERLGPLCETPAAVRFLSLEPLLGPIDFSAVGGIGRLGWGFRNSPPVPGIDWVICGGESGPRARPTDVAWIRSIVEQCRAASVPVFVKQLGARPFVTTWSPGPLTDRQVDAYICEHGQEPDDVTEELRLRDRKGGDMEEWPEDLRVREFPR